jgi:hypothetical protein
MEHDSPAAFIDLAGEHLRARRVLRPPVDALTRMIATARADAHRLIDDLLADELPDVRRGELDALLDGGAGQSSELADLRPRASRASVKELLGQVRHTQNRGRDPRDDSQRSRTRHGAR